MLRQLLTLVSLVVLPFLVYGLAVKYAQARRAEGKVPSWEKAPWFVLSFAAALLVTAFLVWFRLHSAYPPGTVLEPARVENGISIPAHPAE